MMKTRNAFFHLWLAAILFLPAAGFLPEIAAADETGTDDATASTIASPDNAVRDAAHEDILQKHKMFEVLSLDDILARAHQVSETSEEALEDYVCRSTFIMREPQKKGPAKTFLVQEKTTYFKPPDQERDVFLSVTEKGKTLSPEKLAEYQKKADAERRKAEEHKDEAADDEDGKSDTFSVSAASPWAPEQRDRYTFQQLPPDTVRGSPCHVVQMTAREKSEELLNGRVWFHQELFEVVKMDFQPAKNPRFVKKAHVILDFAEVSPGHWLPVEMKTEAAGGILFIKKSFHLHQTWRDYQVNVGLDDSLFTSWEE
jgi:hypothetical protein